MKLIDLLNVIDEETSVNVTARGSNAEVKAWGMNGLSKSDKEIQIKMLSAELLNSEIETIYDNEVVTNFHKEETEKMLKEGKNK